MCPHIGWGYRGLWEDKEQKNKIKNQPQTTQQTVKKC